MSEGPQPRRPRRWRVPVGIALAIVLVLAGIALWTFFEGLFYL